MPLILIVRLIVVAVLAYSGLAKLGAASTATAAQDLGLSPRIAKWVGRWLAPAELLVAGLLFVSASAYAGAIAALVLFAAFTALIAWNLWQGRKPACACFGEAKAEAISNWTLVRDLVFVALAAFLVMEGAALTERGVVGGLANAISNFGLSAAFAVIGLTQAAIFLGLTSRRASAPPSSPMAAPTPVGAASEATGWPPGTLAPAFDLPSLEGTRVTLQDLIARDLEVVLFFTAPDCRHCTALLPEIAQWQERHAGALAIAAVSRGSVADNKDKAQDFGIHDLLLQGGSEVAAAYQALATPAAVVIDRTRRIASRVAIGAVEIRQLVEAWASVANRDAPVRVLSPPPPEGPTRILVGDPAPPFKLPSLRGGDVDLFEFAGRLTIVVFWNPSCGFCRGLAPKLHEREEAQTESSAQMIFVAAGTRAANEVDRFVSPVLLDEGGATARAYGSGGTPSASLVDAESKVASALAVGSAEIEALMQRADLMAAAARRVQA